MLVRNWNTLAHRIGYAISITVDFVCCGRAFNQQLSGDEVQLSILILILRKDDTFNHYVHYRCRTLTRSNLGSGKGRKHIGYRLGFHRRRLIRLFVYRHQRMIINIDFRLQTKRVINVFLGLLEDLFRNCFTTFHWRTTCVTTMIIHQQAGHNFCQLVYIYRSSFSRFNPTYRPKVRR